MSILIDRCLLTNSYHLLYERPHDFDGQTGEFIASQCYFITENMIIVLSLYQIDNVTMYALIWAILPRRYNVVRPQGFKVGFRMPTEEKFWTLADYNGKQIPLCPLIL